LPKENTRPIGENSANPVTLLEALGMHMKLGPKFLNIWELTSRCGGYVDEQNAQLLFSSLPWSQSYYRQSHHN
jgi:hypothetical protein